MNREHNTCKICGEETVSLNCLCDNCQDDLDESNANQAREED